MRANSSASHTPSDGAARQNGLLRETVLENDDKALKPMHLSILSWLIQSKALSETVGTTIYATRASLVKRGGHEYGYG